MPKSVLIDRIKVISKMAENRVTGEELAELAGVSRSSIQKMRKGGNVWRTTATHVARALGVSIESIVAKED